MARYFKIGVDRNFFHCPVTRLKVSGVGGKLEVDATSDNINKALSNGHIIEIKKGEYTEIQTAAQEAQDKYLEKKGIISKDGELVKSIKPKSEVAEEYELEKETGSNEADEIDFESMTKAEIMEFISTRLEDADIAEFNKLKSKSDMITFLGDFTF